jgi:hypothetical protein
MPCCWQTSCCRTRLYCSSTPLRMLPPHTRLLLATPPPLLPDPRSPRPCRASAPSVHARAACVIGPLSFHRLGAGHLLVFTRAVYSPVLPPCGTTSGRCAAAAQRPLRAPLLRCAALQRCQLPRAQLLTPAPSASAPLAASCSRPPCAPHQRLPPAPARLRAQPSRPCAPRLLVRLGLPRRAPLATALGAVGWKYTEGERQGKRSRRWKKKRKRRQGEKK